MMKKSTFWIISFILLSLCCASCKGAAGRRVAQEAVEALSKKGAKSGAEYLEKEGASALEREAATLEREAAALDEEGSSSSSLYRNKRRADHVEDAIDAWTSSDDDDDSYRQRQPQLVYVLCQQCGGARQVYMVDAYGNIMFDYYGNPLVMVCPGCNGAGMQAVYQ